LKFYSVKCIYFAVCIMTVYTELETGTNRPLKTLKKKKKKFRFPIMGLYTKEVSIKIVITRLLPCACWAIIEKKKKIIIVSF